MDASPMHPLSGPEVSPAAPATSPAPTPASPPADRAALPKRFLPPVWPEKKAGPKLGFFFLLFGVVLPCFTLGFELVTHACGTDFFDPIPTWWHVLLVGLVPCANLVAYTTYLGSGKAVPPWKMHLLAASATISCIYAVMYLPMAPFALIGILFMGFGLIPLTPLIAAITALRAWSSLGTPTGLARKTALSGICAALLALGIPAGWDIVTDQLLITATTGTVESQVTAVKWLRRVGHWGLLLERCYRGPRNPFAFFGSQSWRIADQTTKARDVYYRVTGVPYNDQPAPSSVSLTGRRGRGAFNFDANLGGERVANKVSGLTLEGSRIDAKIDPTGLTSYTEWTMVFRNVAANPSEARAQIELPPGGVVSRVSLWINGEPKEAAFGGREQVRAAYREVAVVQRRDPILVTTAGPDRVLMQCFPVPANGEMKVRVGITAPLRVDATRKPATAAVDWPAMVETNFEAGERLQHAVWAESSAPFQNGNKTFQGDFTDRRWREAAPLMLELSATGLDSVAKDPNDANFVIRQTISTVAAQAPSRIVVVIDGSRAADKHQKALARELGRLPADKTTVFVAGDRLLEWPRTGPLTGWLEDQDFGGGCDNVPALTAAWSEAAKEPSGVLLWLHGPQPVLISSMESLIQRIERHPHRPAFYTFSMNPGPNRIIEGLDRYVAVQRLLDGTSFEERLARGRALIDGSAPRTVIRRERIAYTESLAGEPEADRHVARLWGREEVERLRLDSRQVKDAVKLALELQLVTPVSGAVVLERQEQYDRHGLTPVKEDTAPTIPEPGTTALIAATLAFLGMRRHRRKQYSAAVES